MLKRTASPLDPAPNGRLRVVTAGRVGNMDARLGTSGFDVVAVADTEDDLVQALTEDEPDAIVVEADLCPSLEHVRELAPDAVLIVVGDHTPAGALGRIERGVSGTVMAGLLHALVTDGVGAAAVAFGLVPAMEPPTALVLPEPRGATLVAHKLSAIRAYIPTGIREHAGVAAAASTLAVSVSTAVLLVTVGPRPVERVAPPVDAVRIASPQPTGSTPVPSPEPPESPREPSHRQHLGSTGGGREAAAVDPSSGPAAFVAPPSVVDPPAITPPPPTPTTPPPTPPPPTTPPPTTAPPTPEPTATNTIHPPGVANGWDHRPLKHPDNGDRNGWDKPNPSGDHAGSSGPSA